MKFHNAKAKRKIQNTKAIFRRASKEPDRAGAMRKDKNLSTFGELQHPHFAGKPDNNHLNKTKNQ